MPGNGTFLEKFGVPPAAYPVIDFIVTPAEQAICAGIKRGVFAAADVQRVIEDGENAAAFTATAYRRGLFNLENREQGLYRLSDFYHRLDVFVVSETERYRSFDGAVKRAINDWYFDAYYTSLNIAPDRRPTEDAVVTREEALAVIRGETRQAFLAPCDCRSLQAGLEESCGKPVRTCISWRSGDNTFSDRGLSKPITKDEALRIVTEADAAGLMHTANPNGLCNCCSDCCFLSRGRVRRNAELRGNGDGSFLAWPAAGKAVQFSQEDCVGCGACLSRCPFGLFTQKNGKAAVDRNRCVGCGLCVNTCPANALTLGPV
jgi:Pyruvate/2-oxoacid:ferredoxin oxidoreductase delta subunit